MKYAGYTTASGGYELAAARMTQEVEYRLFSYAHLKKEVREYRNACLEGSRAPQEERVKAAPRGSCTEQNALRMMEPGGKMKEKMRWVAVIERAWEEMRYFSPGHARVLEAVYGLTRPPNSRPQARSAYARYALMEELHISQTTLYNWKNTCIAWVKALALHRGLLCPDMELPIAGSGERGKTN